MIFINGGFPTLHALGIRPDGSGDVTSTHVLWHERQGAGYVPSPIAFGKWIFIVNDDGLTTCFEAKTGKRAWTQQLGKHHRPSPVCAEGRLYFLDDVGDMHVFGASDKFELIAKNGIGEDCYASPAISGGEDVHSNDEQPLLHRQVDVTTEARRHGGNALATDEHR